MSQSQDPREIFEQAKLEVGIFVILPWLAAGFGFLISMHGLKELPTAQVLGYAGAGILFAGGLFKLLYLWRRVHQAAKRARQSPSNALPENSPPPEETP